MNETEINWTELTWNPASGCTKVSAECKYCYAQTLAENKRGTRAFPNGFDMTIRPWKLDEPRRVKRPSLIFTNSMTDMFHAQIPDEYRDQICDVIEQYPQHRYQVLTKRPEVAARYFQRRPVPDSLWLGVTCGIDETLGRVDILRTIDARVRFVSAEPLLSALPIRLDGIHWLIAGGESGSHLSDPHTLELRGLVRRGDRRGGESLWVPREDRVQWIADLRDRCLEAGTAFWFKQWGGPRPAGGGRVLDGRTWDQMPTHVPGAMPESYVHRASRQSHAQVSLPVVA